MKKDNKFLGFLIVLIYGVFAITIIIPMVVTAIIFTCAIISKNQISLSRKIIVAI